MGFRNIKILNKVNKNKLFLILFLISAILGARLWPHAPNFSPLASLILFGAVYHPQKRFLFWPFLALFISDIVIGFYAWPIMLAVYGSLILTALIGYYLKNKVNFFNIINASLGSALLFFLITNGAVWFFGDWYSHNLTGLMLCYSLGVPFFRNTVLSNLLYSSALFFLYEFWLAWKKSPTKKLLWLK